MFLNFKSYRIHYRIIKLANYHIYLLFQKITRMNFVVFNGVGAWPAI